MSTSLSFKVDLGREIVYIVNEVDSTVTLMEDLVSYMFQYKDGVWTLLDDKDGLDKFGRLGHMLQSVAYK